MIRWQRRSWYGPYNYWFSPSLLGVYVRFSPFPSYEPYVPQEKWWLWHAIRKLWLSRNYRH